MATTEVKPNILDYSLRSDIKPNARPFFYAASDNKILAILVHGFSGSPYDLDELGRYLAERGINARGVLLAGHGGDYEYFAQAGHKDWWQSVKNELDQYEGKYDKIFLIGYSFGSNLVLDISSRFPDKLCGVICMSASVFLRNEKKIKFLRFVMSKFTDRAKKRKMPKERRAVYEAGGRHLIIPLKGLADFYYFIENITKRQLDNVRIPILLIHSRDDEVSSPRSSEYIFEKIGSEDKELFILSEFEHNPLNSSNRDIIFTKIIEFISSH